MLEHAERLLEERLNTVNKLQERLDAIKGQSSHEEQLREELRGQIAAAHQMSDTISDDESMGSTFEVGGNLSATAGSSTLLALVSPVRKPRKKVVVRM
jgi:hypothetical protein